jgi:hypothetical protein
VADDGDQIAMPTRLDPQNAEAAFGIVEVTRSTMPAKTSWFDESAIGLMEAIVSFNRLSPKLDGRSKGRSEREAVAAQFLPFNLRQRGSNDHSV